MIYLDYQATTPLAPEAFAAMKPWLESQHANPHSAHKAGRAAAAAVEVARAQILELLPAGGKLIFTSGATEAINLAIKGLQLKSVGYSAIEHAAVIDTAEALKAASGTVEVCTYPVKSCGSVEISEIDALPSLTCVMHVNNEIGTIQTLSGKNGLIAQAKNAGANFLVDAVQSFGRMPVPQEADMIAISAHKIHGPKGIGALWLRDGIELTPLLHGGGQEQGVRSGTLSPALCAGFGAAAKLAKEQMEADSDHVRILWQRAMELFAGWHINGSVENRYHGNLNIRRDGLDVGRLMSECRDIMFSAGSACASGSGRPSHVLQAIGLDDAQAKSSIRLGWGRYTALEELERAARTINEATERQLT